MHFPTDQKKTTYTFLMNSAKRSVWCQKLCGGIFMRAGNEYTLLEEGKKGIEVLIQIILLDKTT